MLRLVLTRVGVVLLALWLVPVLAWDSFGRTLCALSRVVSGGAGSGPLFTPCALPASYSVADFVRDTFLVLLVWTLLIFLLEFALHHFRFHNKMFQFGLVFGLGLFLSISAIAVVDTFEGESALLNTPPEELGLLISRNQSPADLLREVEPFLEDLRAPITAEGQAGARAQEVQGVIDTNLARFGRYVTNLATLAERRRLDVTGFLNNLTGHLRELVRSPVRPFDQFVNLSLLHDAYAEYHRLNLENLRKRIDELQGYRAEIVAWVDSDETVSYLNGTAQTLSPLDLSALREALEASDTVRPLSPADISLLSPSLGSNLGPYAFTRWLLRISSLDLVLITGMLGFGLLGSAVSSFVRQQVSTGNKIVPPVVDSVFIILMTGVSAAVVVYLAVKGGLEVVTNDGGEIDPYALFFTCLVASVFSDVAWQWAVNRFSKAKGAASPPDSGR